MKTPMHWATLTAGVAAVFFLACASAEPVETRDARILVFSKTTEFRHVSIEPGIEALQRLAAVEGIQVDATEDASVFSANGLSAYNAVVFLSTTGDVLDTQQEQALTDFIEGGGGYLGIHAASDTEYDWAWYGRLVGGYFSGHPNNPNVREGTLLVAEADHPSTSDLPDPWTRTDEWYDIRDLQPDVTVLLNIDEQSYKAANENPAPNPRPIAWYHTVGEGRAFYTTYSRPPRMWARNSGSP